MAWKICGLLGTITLGLAAMGCDSSSDGGGDTSSGTSAGGASTTGVTSDGATSTTGANPYVGHLLSPNNGWVARDTNDAGIQGAFYTFSDNDDGGTFLIEPASYATAGASICATGTAEQVMNAEYSVYWGGAIGFNLNQDEGEDTPAMPFDATTAGVTGFGFDISALPIGGQLRFNVLVAGEETNNYCATISAQTGNEFRWDDLKLSCWAAEAATPNPAMIQAVHWQIVTNESAPYDFDFCVTNITALTN